MLASLHKSPTTAATRCTASAESTNDGVVGALTYIHSGDVAVILFSRSMSNRKPTRDDRRNA